ncbi:MAG TPA: response regulator transcription factor [Actinomycetota bacterium]|jgi:DNA-binding response OmpR family regulator|nr:response regulator transcription factor [Actinomycetota bacterium]
MRILVVEDEEDLARAIATGLRREGYAVDLVHDGNDALDKLRLYPYDLICLDLNLPGVDGREIARSARNQSASAEGPRILMVTARDTVEDRVGGLDDGADDYLVKPFDYRELSARVRAVLRRPTADGGGVLRVGSLELDAARHEASDAGRPLKLTPKEFALLRYFMSRAGEVLSQEELLEHVWDENADLFSSSRVRVAVMGLRRKLGDDQPIETVVGRGYRLREDN